MILPHRRFSRYGFEDRDNFIRNLVTILGVGVFPDEWVRVPAPPHQPVAQPAPLAKSRAADPPVLDLPTIKLYCRIEIDQPDEDSLLTNLERAARIHTENELQRTIDATVGENVKQAMLALIDHWYRNREAIIVGTIATVTPLSYQSLIFPEKNFLNY